jgi:hypothetical protein
VYPNPSSTNIHVQLPNNIELEHLVLYNELGQKVLEQSAVDCSVAALETGVYDVAIQTSVGTYHKKFIKK